MTNDPSRFAVASWGKENQLLAMQSIKSGEIIIAEKPFIAVSDLNLKHETYAWDLVDKILSSGKTMERYLKLRLKESIQLMDSEDQRLERYLAKKHRLTTNMVRRIYFSVCTNNIGYKDTSNILVGHAIYPIISRANHSCRPNASYASGDLQTKEITLVAVGEIETGDAVTWSYAGTEPFLNADFSERNFHLLNAFRFLCKCDRCQEEIPPELAAHPNLIQHFDHLLMKSARQQAKEAIAQIAYLSNSASNF